MTELMPLPGVSVVPLGGKKAAGRVALVDDDDFDLVSRYHWTIFEPVRGGRVMKAYARTWGADPGGIFMHALILAVKGVDHVNHDGLDNRRRNLRPVTPAQNSANRRPNRDHSSAFKGVGWEKDSRRWRASMRVNGRLISLGRFADESDAAHAYDAAALAAWGEYACLNFPEGIQ